MSHALQTLMVMPEPRDSEGRATSGLLSFLLIGGGAALAYVGVSTIAVALLPQVEAWIVSAFCYAGMVLPVYLLHRRFSFRSEAGHLQALPRYIGVQMMAVLLATGFGYLFHGALALPTLAAGLLVVSLTSGMNFIVLRRWAFARSARVAAAARVAPVPA